MTLSKEAQEYLNGQIQEWIKTCGREKDAEIERLRAALSDVATFVSAPRPAAMSELDWAYCNLSTMQSYAREALGVNEQSTRLFNTWECTNCGQFHPFTVSICPNSEGERR